jgi:hypothetical protein
MNDSTINFFRSHHSSFSLIILHSLSESCQIDCNDIMNRFHSAIILILAIAPQCEKAAAFQPPPSFFPSVISSSVLFSSTDRQITKKIDDAVDKVVQKPVHQNPIGHTVLPLPLECYDESVVCFQRATNTRIRGLEELQRACRQWDRDFVDELSGDYDDSEGNFFKQNSTHCYH